MKYFSGWGLKRPSVVFLILILIYFFIQWLPIFGLNRIKNLETRERLMKMREREC